MRRLFGNCSEPQSLSVPHWSSSCVFRSISPKQTVILKVPSFPHPILPFLSCWSTQGLEARAGRKESLHFLKFILTIWAGSGLWPAPTPALLLLLLTVYQSLCFTYVHSVLDFSCLVTIHRFFWKFFCLRVQLWNLWRIWQLQNIAGIENTQNLNFQSHLQVYTHLILEHQDRLHALLM